MQDERWTRLPAIIPGDAPIDMQQVYVELNVIPTEELRADAIAQITKLQRLPRQRVTSEYGVMSALVNGRAHAGTMHRHRRAGQR